MADITFRYENVVLNPARLGNGKYSFSYKHICLPTFFTKISLVHDFTLLNGVHGRPIDFEFKPAPHK